MHIEWIAGGCSRCSSTTPLASPHRNQASVTGVTKFVSRSYPGPLIRKEVECLAHGIDVPKRPFVVILGELVLLDAVCTCHL